MKIVVLNNCVPFLRGGAEHLADALAAKLVEHGHKALVVRIPFRWAPPEKIVEHMLACRLMRVPGVDRVIAFKFPAYYVPHPDKVLWLLHQFRQAYDLWGTRFQGLADSPEGREIRELIIRGDNSYLPEARKIYTNSEVTSGRLKKFNGLDSEVLYPPLLTHSQYSCAEYGDYIFCPGRVNATKRQLLLVQAMQHCRTRVKLLVAGCAETREDAEAIESTIRKNGLEKKVQFVNRFISEEEKVDWFGRSLGCAYIPYDEDSYGYVTLESYLSRKPVITCSDSGGIEALAREGSTGRVVAPEPRVLAEAMDQLFLDKQKAQRMGEAGLELVHSLRITWDTVIEKLTK
ncbi:MAG TPA: glycosyltransferase family 4 protein [Bryobacteraceae bacterium]|nr:glycosyltransferase family 4 protein [Bryobacteraceae bacterium]